MCFDFQLSPLAGHYVRGTVVCCTRYAVRVLRTVQYVAPMPIRQIDSLGSRPLTVPTTYPPTFLAGFSPLPLSPGLDDVRVLRWKWVLPIYLLTEEREGLIFVSTVKVFKKAIMCLAIVPKAQYTKDDLSYIRIFFGFCGLHLH